MWISFFSLPPVAGFFLYVIHFAISKPFARTAQRMTPVDASRLCWQWPSFVQVSMLLPQFVREKKRDDQQGNDQENPEYHVLVHDSLQVQEICFHCRAPLVSAALQARRENSRNAAGTIYFLHLPRYRAYPLSTAE